MIQPSACRASEPGAGRDHQRHAAEDRRDHGHQHRAEADVGCFFDRLAHTQPTVAQLVGEFDDQDAVLGHDADDKDQADLANRC